jgi:hypothetical protein
MIDNDRLPPVSANAPAAILPTLARRELRDADHIALTFPSRLAGRDERARLLDE